MVSIQDSIRNQQGNTGNDDDFEHWAFFHSEGNSVGISYRMLWVDSREFLPYY